MSAGPTKIRILNAARVPLRVRDRDSRDRRDMAETTAPEGKKENTDEDEGGAQSDPESEGTPMLTKAEPCTERESHKPVGAKVADHRRACVTGAAEGSGGDGLKAVEKLEGGAGSKENDGVVDEDWIVGVDARDVFGEDEQDDTHAEHERRAQQDGRVAGVAGAQQIVASDRLANADGGGGGDAKGDHISEGDGVKRDLMAGQGNGAKARDE